MKRRVNASARFRRLGKTVLINALSAAETGRTSRATLLALSELVRRAHDPPSDALDLTPFELKVFSQNGEDGVIAEILRRSEEGDRYFVEFGASNGLEGNCVALADVFGWSGLFMESDETAFARLEFKYRSNSGVATRRAAVTAENVQSLFREAGVPEHFAVLSIDVDGADYWIWHALQRFRPRVVVIEYNAALDHDGRLVQPPDAKTAWDRTIWHGASLGALRGLAEERGYRLVHTEMTGTNAFFVRNDLPGDYPDPEDVPIRAANYALAGGRHLPDPADRPFIDLDA